MTPYRADIAASPLYKPQAVRDSLCPTTPQELEVLRLSIWDIRCAAESDVCTAQRKTRA